MTAKGKIGGRLGRLARLEEARAAQVEEIRAKNWAHIEAAEARLSAADRAAWKDAGDVLERGTDPEAVARMRRACAHLFEGLPVEHPAKEEADAWEALDVPDGAPLARPPADRVEDFLAYFELCAAWCDAQALRVPLSPDVQRLARWGVALWRFETALCQEMSGAGERAWSASIGGRST
jgi:hypothetical protein